MENKLISITYVQSEADDFICFRMSGVYNGREEEETEMYCMDPHFGKKRGNVFDALMNEIPDYEDEDYFEDDDEKLTS